jgi:hypothetical protein
MPVYQERSSSWSEVSSASGLKSPLSCPHPTRSRVLSEVEFCQRMQAAAELFAPGEVEPSERSQPSQLWWEASQVGKIAKI